MRRRCGAHDKSPLCFGSMWHVPALLFFTPCTLRTRTPILGDLWRSLAIFTARSLAILADLWRSFRSEKYIIVRRGNERSLAIFGDPCGCARIARDRQGSAGIALRITAPAIQRPLAPPQFSAPTSNSAAPNPGARPSGHRLPDGLPLLPRPPHPAASWTSSQSPSATLTGTGPTFGHFWPGAGCLRASGPLTRPTRRPAPI